MPPVRPGGKVDRRLEEDELFKQIGGQLDASNFDYSQWQRTGKLPHTDATISKAALDSVRTVEDSPSPHAKKSFTVASGPGLWNQQKRGTESPCQHGRKKDPAKKQTVNAAYKAAVAKQKAEQIKILQLRIRARKQTISEYKKRQAHLLLDNINMKDSIVAEEKDAHADVKKLLRKYEKYRGGINSLNDQFTDELYDAKTALEETTDKVDAEISVLQKLVDDIDARLKHQQDELHVLVNYKDKEYPVKSLHISELRTEIVELSLSQEEEQKEMQHIVDTEIDKFQHEERQISGSIMEKATEEAIAAMHPSLKDMAMQNIVMLKEIDFHTNEIENVEEKIVKLDQEVKDMLRDPKTNTRQQMFPEFFPTREKCTPDMEVVLDIPTQEWLPI